MPGIERILFAMISIRIISSIIEMCAAYLMFHFKSITTAIRINAILGLIGPVILMMVTFLGLIGISNQLSLVRIIIIGLGVCLILIGTH